MADTEASELRNCDEEVPLLGVTREFDFGQFIELFDNTLDPRLPGVPPVSRVVIQPNSTLAADRNAASNDPGSAAAGTASSSSSLTGDSDSAPAAKSEKASPKPSSILAPSQAPQPPIAFREAEVNLFDLMERGPGAKLAPVALEIRDSKSLFEKGVVRFGGSPYKVTLDEAQKNDLTMGLAVTAYGTPEAGEAAVPLRLSLPFEPIRLSTADLSRVLSGNALDGYGNVKPMLTAPAIRTLLAGGTVMTHGVGPDGSKKPIALAAPGAASPPAPMARKFQVFDLPSFLSKPDVLAMDGTPLPVELIPRNVDELIRQGRTEVGYEGAPIEIILHTDTSSSEYKTFLEMEPRLAEHGLPPVKPFGPGWPPIPPYPVSAAQPYFVHPHIRISGAGQPAGRVAPVGTGGGVPVAQAGTMTDMVQPRLPSGSGLPVAVFVPWKQTWTLKGFSRGNLLHSIALAPSEQVTMQVNSWERRSRTLEQSSETEVDQQTDISQSTRDTEDVFKEMLAKRDFAWQLSGSIDASYSPGVASIKVHAGGGVSETNSIQQTARNSSQSVRESTIKASGRVRSKRVTRVTQSVESGKEERVTRVIGNPNQCHTLTLDFFETLAHYEIGLKFQKDRLRLVVLVPNPVKVPDFNSALIRRNETALRNALIETALVEGFEACRMVAAYDEARFLVNLQKSEAARVEEMEAQRSVPPPPGQAASPASPQEEEVVRVVAEMVAALKAIRSGAGIDAALTAIAAHRPVDESVRRKGQQWLFINFCAAKFPALLSVLDDIAIGSATGVAAAQKIMSVLPRPDAPTNLGNLNQMSDAEKEGCCLASKLKEEAMQSGHMVRKYMKMDWDWGWWTTRLKEENLYSSNDGGIGGMADQLQKSYQAWEAKKAQGDAMKDQDVAKTEAEGKQEKAGTEDKLSMSFPLEDLARAYERMKVLADHLNEHRDFYNYALFQALPPGEQAMRLVEASNGRLQVGLFEPRVVAMSGSRLVVPLTPLSGSAQLQTFVTTLAADLDAAFSSSLVTPDLTVLPTPGVSISSRLGKCTGCEEFIESSRTHELARLQALARQEVLEADRRDERLKKGNLEDFTGLPAAVRLEVENKTSLPR